MWEPEVERREETREAVHCQANDAATYEGETMTVQVKPSKAEFKQIQKLFDAWQALTRLGWSEPRWFKFPPVGVEFELIELGSTGIHRAVRHAEKDKTCWVDYKWPSDPCLCRAIPKEKS